MEYKIKEPKNGLFMKEYGKMENLYNQKIQQVLDFKSQFLSQQYNV